MKNYKIVHEAKDHFVLHDNNDNRQFKMPKKALSEKTYQHVKSLPRFATEGGIVTGSQPQQYGNYSSSNDIEQQLASQPSQIGNVMSDYQNGLRAEKGLPPIDQSAPQVQPVIPVADPIQPVIQPKPIQSAPTVSENPATALKSPFAEGNALLAKGITSGVQAQTDLGNSLASTYDDLAKKQQESADEFEFEHDAANKQTEDLYHKILTTKINPNQFWQNKSTANSIGTVIAIVLGGLGQGLSGKGSNAAMDVVNKQIDNDIQAQKDNLGNQKNMLSINLEKTKNLESAYSLTRSQLLAATAAQVSKAQASAMGPEAKARGDELMGQLKNQASLQNANYLQTQAKAQLSQGQGNVNPELLDKETRDRLVTLPNGQQTLATTSDDAKDIKEVNTGADQFQDIISRMRALRAKRSGGTVFSDTDTAIAKSLQARALTTLNGLKGLKRLSEAEISQFEREVPSVLDFTTTDSKVNAKLDALQDEVNAARIAVIKNRTSVINRPVTKK